MFYKTMPTNNKKKQFYRQLYKDRASILVIEESKTYDKFGIPVFDQYCPICMQYRGKLRRQASFLPCKSCGQTGKKSTLLGKGRSCEFKQKIAAGNLRYRTKVNPNYRLRTPLEEQIIHTLRTRLWQTLKGITKSQSALDLLGCSLVDLKHHLESLFQPGMTWENWSRTGWHIDHIKPLAYFDLSDPMQLKSASHYTNLQPLWAKDNLRKGSK